jgi:hypothetical protein
VGNFTPQKLSRHKKIKDTEKEAAQIILKQNSGKPSIKKRKVQCKPNHTSRSKINTQEDDADPIITEEVEVEYL